MKNRIYGYPIHEGRVLKSAFILLLSFLLCAFNAGPAFSLQAGQSEVLSTQSEPLSMEITYDAPLVCGETSTFTFSAKGGAGEYQFRPYTFQLKVNGQWNLIGDFSYSKYEKKNTFDYRFTIPGEYKLTFSVFDRIPDTEQFHYEHFSIYATVFDAEGSFSDYDQRISRMNEIIEQVYQESESAGKTSEYDRALFFHDWIIEHCDYDTDLNANTADFLFIDGKGTCEAYHSAYMALLKRANIACGRVTDKGHVWTSVRIDGQWCHVDTTGDDNSGEKDNWYGVGAMNTHLLFGLNDSAIQAKLALNNDRIQTEDPSFTASSIQNSYLVRTGALKNYSDPVATQVSNNLKQGKTSFSIPIAVSELPASYRTVIYSQVAFDLASRSWSLSGSPCFLKATYANGSITCTADIPKKPMYRLYNPYSGEHLFTADAHERSVLVGSYGWNDEGIGWYAPLYGEDVYRLYNRWTGEHLYTTDAHERDVLRRGSWNYEGVAFKSASATTGKKVYRLYTPYNPNFSHHFTLDTYERDYITRYYGWIYEGIGWYGV